MQSQSIFTWPVLEVSKEEEFDLVDSAPQTPEKDFSQPLDMLVQEKLHVDSG